MDAGAHPFVARVVRALAARPGVLAGRDGTFREAAVALVLRPLAVDDAELLLIRRAERADDPWSGQIGLPGGGIDPTDTSLEHTAIRETREEVGLDLVSHGRVLGTLDDLRPRTPHLPSIIVRPFVTVYTGDPAVTISDEVAEARWVPLSALRRPEARVRTTVLARGFTLDVDAVQHEDFIIWGMTARILAGFEGLLR